MALAGELVEGMNTIRRIRYKNWYIQSRKCRPGLRHSFVAWATREPCVDDISYAFAGNDVYSNFGDTEIEAIETTKKELDSLGDNSHGNS